ncbi:MAG: threonine--tRNA ligase [Deltaproteobacteria bacterium]|nr:threonine--tRNA ligase [Deltaproteobacteria bacterium]
MTDISVILPDGSKKTLPHGATAADLALSISAGLAKAVVAARVKLGAKTEVRDLQAPLVDGAQVWLLKLDDKDAQDIMRHSAEHVLATAVCRLFPGAQVTMGPRDHGKEFYYDFDIGRPFTPEDLERIEAEMQKLITEDKPFIRREVPKPQAREEFKQLGQKYKDQILDWIPDDNVTIYQNHDFTDLCRGPHLPSTGRIKAVKLTGVAGAYWRGDQSREMLQRISGQAFTSKDEMTKHFAQLEEAKKRDHRKLGKELELFFFDPLAPASPFFLPRGALVYNKLVEYVRKLYVKYGYDEVVTPQIFDTKLFKTSGHYDNYEENMYFGYGGLSLRKLNGLIRQVAEDNKDNKDLFAKDVFGDSAEEDVEWREFGVKPMNCPGHCILYAHSLHSHRDLPMRIADFGRLHRFEKGGVTHGLARVRTFSQDDAHIFCTPDQVQAEIVSFVNLLDEVYRAFEFNDVRIRLATRPEKRAGSDADWDRAEKALEEALMGVKREFTFSPGEGAFYGPKLEFHVKDALERSWQLGTIQVDYVLPGPDRFALTFINREGAKDQVVMLHRAILGSLERFLGVYLEHIGGKFPAWLAPEQARILPITDEAMSYANELRARLLARGLRVDLDARQEKLGFKVREAQLMQVPFALVIGNKEVADKGVTVRQRGGKDLGFMAEDALTAFIVKECTMPG